MSGKQSKAFRLYWLVVGCIQSLLPISRHWLRGYHGFEHPMRLEHSFRSCAMYEGALFQLCCPQPTRQSYGVEVPSVASNRRRQRLVPGQLYSAGPEDVAIHPPGQFDQPQFILDLFCHFPTRAFASISCPLFLYRVFCEVCEHRRRNLVSRLRRPIL